MDLKVLLELNYSFFVLMVLWLFFCIVSCAASFPKGGSIKYIQIKFYVNVDIEHFVSQLQKPAINGLPPTPKVLVSEYL